MEAAVIRLANALGAIANAMHERLDAEQREFEARERRDYQDQLLEKLPSLYAEMMNMTRTPGPDPDLATDPDTDIS